MSRSDYVQLQADIAQLECKVSVLEAGRNSLTARVEQCERQVASLTADLGALEVLASQLREPRP